ncbi:MAG: hypothetical protein WD768_04590 [Phycisphaeraceae bacterium]
MRRIVLTIAITLFTCAAFAGCQAGPEPFGVIEPNYSYVRHGLSTGGDVAAPVSVVDAEQ